MNSETTTSDDTEPSELVAIPITPEMVHLALIAADGFERLGARELVKLQSLLQLAEGKFRPTANNLRDLCAHLGFVFAASLNDARKRRIAEKAASDGAASCPQQH
ncbi:hypothetical protein EKK58_12215 [Candidatus Dependentiae bacterium]|nr:MAG: hypothetical protein EKK58_12215 [Candidatus Dependentiae bacterium]